MNPPPSTSSQMEEDVELSAKRGVVSLVAVGEAEAGQLEVEGGAAVVME